MDRGELHKDSVVSTALYRYIFMLNTHISKHYIVLSSVLLSLMVQRGPPCLVLHN